MRRLTEKIMRYKTRRQLKEELESLKPVFRKKCVQVKELEKASAEKEKKIDELENGSAEKEAMIDVYKRVQADNGHKLAVKRNDYVALKARLERCSGERDAVVDERNRLQGDVDEKLTEVNRLKVELKDSKKTGLKWSNRASELLSQRNKLKGIVEGINRKWRCLGFSVDGNKVFCHFESPSVGSGDAITRVVKVPADLNLSAVENTNAEKNEALVYLSDKAGGYDLQLPRGLYEYARSLVEKMIKKERGLKGHDIFGERLSLSVLCDMMPVSRKKNKKEEKVVKGKSARVLEYLRSNIGVEMSIKEIAAGCGMGVRDVEKPLGRLVRSGACKRVGRGVYVFVERV